MYYFMNFLTMLSDILPVLEPVLCILGIVALYMYIKNH